MPLASAIPRMFHRRLLLLGLLLALAFVPPACQMVRLTLWQGEQLRDEAERRLVSRQWMPTVRGRILDRRDRVLAADRPAYDISVDYPVITGQWARDQAARAARKAHAGQWRKLAPEQREALIEAAERPFRERLDAMWTAFASLSGLSRPEIERRKQEIIAEVEMLAGAIRRIRLEREDQLTRSRDAAVDIDASFDDRPIREQTVPHAILRAASDEIAFAFMAHADTAPEGDRLPGLHVIDGATRVYPFDLTEVTIDRSAFPTPVRAETPATLGVEGSCAQVIGTMRQRIFEEDIKRRPMTRLTPDGGTVLDRGFYQAGDAVGRLGIEASAEDDLRGLRGVRTVFLDSGIEDVVAPSLGRDAKLTLDAMLQARVQAVLAPELGLTRVQAWHNNAALPLGTPLAGAAAVLDVDTGDILALVSSPTYSARALAENPASVFEDKERLPFLNRAIARPYPPGSIIKPLVLCAAVSSGRYDLPRPIACTGHFLPDKPEMLRCWIYKQSGNTLTHSGTLGHDLAATEAIMVSCNIFFFTLGRDTGPQVLSDWLTRFGVGRDADRWRLGIGDEYAGSLGPERAARQPTLSETVQMAIGQGPVAWTPLHAADAYATIARGGVRVIPRLRFDEPQRTTQLSVDPAAIAAALEGLRLSVNDERGTTHHIKVIDAKGNEIREPTFTHPDLTIWGKSGTADSGKRVGEVEDDSPDTRPAAARSLDHSWVVVLVGHDRPQYAIAVVIEQGGSGGRVAGPVVNQIVHALRDEGYL
ncbi:MAG: hypothetical protein JNM07_01320 [Phycisphaerae bacterium]|nr:hypothetical protein [Phycisphaerae bacterium]